MHGEFQPMGEVHFHNRFDEQPPTPNQLRWSPLPIPPNETDWLDGLFTMAATAVPANTAAWASMSTPGNKDMAGALFYGRRRRAGLVRSAQREWWPSAAGIANREARGHWGS
jgi:homogentisate 1,2-dioxygenase